MKRQASLLAAAPRLGLQRAETGELPSAHHPRPPGPWAEPDHLPPLPLPLPAGIGLKATDAQSQLKHLRPHLFQPHPGRLPRSIRTLTPLAQAVHVPVPPQLHCCQSGISAQDKYLAYIDLNTYRVNENHTLVLQPQELSHKVQITSEFGEETVHLRLFDLDDERLGAVDALS